MDAAPIPSPQSLEAPPLLSFPKVIPEEAGDALQLPCAVSCSGQLALLHVPYTTSCARAVSCPAWGLSPCPSSSLSAATTSQGRANPACAFPGFGNSRFLLAPSGSPQMPTQPRGIFPWQSSGATAGKGELTGRAALQPGTGEQEQGFVPLGTALADGRGCDAPETLPCCLRDTGGWHRGHGDSDSDNDGDSDCWD